MAKFTIYSKDGATARHTGEPQYSGSYMGVDYVEFRSVSSPTPIDWQIGDYVDYYRTGKRYKLYSLPMPKKVARKGDYGASFEYSNVQLHGATKELEVAPFRDLVPKDNKIHFSTRPDVSTYEDVYGIARRIQECMDDIFPNRWRIEVHDTDDADLLALFGKTKEYSVSNGSCLDALSQIYDTWKNVGWIHTYDSANEVDVITIGRANVRDTENTSDAFAYGIGKGLTSIKKASANEGEFATRLYVYGSERNIQTRYYNGQDILNKDSVDIRNLMLPIEKWGKTDGLPDARKAYLQADDSIIEKYGLIPRTVYFDGNENEEIYPSITGLTMAQVRQAMIDAGQGDSEFLPGNYDIRIDKVYIAYSSYFDNGTKDEVERNRTFKIALAEPGFNIAEQGRLTSEGEATISIKTGKCAGREFKVKKFLGQRYESDGMRYQEYEVERNWDESLGMGFPNTIYTLESGDEFVLLDIPMPDFYIALAEDRLLKAGEKMLADYTRVSAFYDPSIDAIKIKAGGKLLQAGMFMQVYDEDIIDTADNKDYVLIDTLTIDEKIDLPIYKVTLREQKRSARTYSALEDMIEDAKEVSRQDIRRERQYTERRFRSAQETLELLQAAFKNFSEGISPVTVRTMAMLVGDESLQFKFTASRDSLSDIDCPLSYDESTKQLKGSAASLIHMTLGVNAVTTPGALSASDYRSWNIGAKNSAILNDAEQSYYVYVKAHQSDATAEYILSDTVIGMEDECNEAGTGHYHFLVGILNSEYNGTRDFVTLYGFTEVLPGQITTDILRSGNGNLIIDLAKAIITARHGATIKGNVTIEEGSIMTSRLDVGDPETEEPLAFFNGGDFAKDTAVDPHSDQPCGKLILAAGIPETTEGGNTELEERAKEATTRIYEDGCTYSKNIHLEDGCTIGNLKISTLKDTDSDGNEVIRGSIVSGKPILNGGKGYIQLNDQGLSTQGWSNNNQVEFVNMGDFCGGHAMGIFVGTGFYCSQRDKDVGLEIDAPNSYAIYVNNGIFAGLRPKTRCITQHDTLSNIDYHVLVDTRSETWIKLPSNPELGQTHEIHCVIPQNAANFLVYLQTEDGTVIHEPQADKWNNQSIGWYAFGVIKVVFHEDREGGRSWWAYRLA